MLNRVSNDVNKQRSREGMRFKRRGGGPVMDQTQRLPPPHKQQQQQPAPRHTPTPNPAPNPHNWPYLSHIFRLVPHLGHFVEWGRGGGDGFSPLSFSSNPNHHNNHFSPLKLAHRGPNVY